MERIRIRWKNVARPAAGVAALALALAFGPGLLRPAPPAPLPPDVGLLPTGGAADRVANRNQRGSRRRHRPEGDARERPAPAPRHRSGAKGPADRGTSDHRPRDRDSIDAHSDPPSTARPALTAAPAPAPAPAPAAQPQAAAPPQPAPPPLEAEPIGDHPPSPASADPPQASPDHEPAPVATEFGFEH